MGNFRWSPLNLWGLEEISNRECSIESGIHALRAPPVRNWPTGRSYCLANGAAVLEYTARQSVD
jgi:hypothetical protein